MSLDALLSARRQILAEKAAKRVASERCQCGESAVWRDEHGTWRCTRHEKERLAAEGRLPPGIGLEE